jgi:hypothetical protein
MTLQEILYGKWTPPENTYSRPHRIGLSGGSRYTQPSKRTFKDTDGLGVTEKKVFDILKKYNDFVPVSVLAKEAKISKPNCSLVMTHLHKKGYTHRRFEQKPSVRYYVYMAKETT